LNVPNSESFRGPCFVTIPCSQVGCSINWQDYRKDWARQRSLCHSRSFKVTCGTNRKPMWLPT